jgi:NADPH:quinone reductase-like Zn-dependent oxidoreductase
VVQATLWGLGNVITQEHPELTCVRVDLDPAGMPDEIDALLHTVHAQDGEDQIALRPNQRLVARLVRSEETMRFHENRPQQHSDGPVQLMVSARGTFDGLEIRPLARRAPGPGEVEVEVHATGLGFRDVLDVLGMVTQETGPLGGECAGYVSSTGAGVDAFQVGDAVIVMALGTFCSYVTVPVNLVSHKPKELNLVEAATIPSAFLTSYYTLHHLAGISAGDRVLIHAAAGGVGLAAVQLAQRAGAEIYATAGNQAKRALLKSLGVHHVFDSRSVAFADEIMRITEGRGVDIVLNSLAGEFIPKSLSTLAENGRFLEIGKRDVWTKVQVAQVKPAAMYAVADLISLAERDSLLIRRMFQELVKDFDAGKLQPLPLQVFPIRRAADAFRHMAQARHIGKIVVSHAPAWSRATQPVIRDSGSYLVTGGLGGLGLAVAKWLVERGARQVVLMGRKAPSPSVEVQLQGLREAGAQITVIQADVSQADEMRLVMAEIDQELPRLRGIIHAAGVLEDGALLQQEWSRFDKVFAPKVLGGWNLHRLTRNRSLDFVVYFSSAVTMLGSAGQSNYVAANAFLDALAHYQHSQGMPALSINWGPWSDVGMAATNGREQRLASHGIGTMTSHEAVKLLEQTIERSVRQDEAACFCQVGVISIDWSRFRHASTEIDKPPILREMLQDATRRTVDHEVQKSIDELRQGADELRRRLAEMPVEQHQAMLVGYVRDQSLKVLGLDPSYPLDRRKPLRELGLDSLMAVELRNCLGAGLALQQKLPATLVFDYPTVESLAGYLAAKANVAPSSVAASSVTILSQQSPSTARSESQRVAVADLEKISDEDAEALLLAKLGTIRKGK